jgi:hypothetical protein
VAKVTYPAFLLLPLRLRKNLKMTKKEIIERLMLTPVFRELSPEDKKNLINYVDSTYASLSIKSQKGRRKEGTH